MGKGHSKSSALKEKIELILNPDNEEALKTWFAAYDADSNGSLDKEEWKKFGLVLFDVDNEIGLTEVKEEIKAKFKAKAPAMKGMIASAAGSAVSSLNKEVKPHDIDEWVKKMFEKADKDNDGTVSFQEFKDFLQKENLEFIKEYEGELKEAVATNMDQHRGVLEVKDGAKTITVNVSGMSGNDIRK